MWKLCAPGRVSLCMIIRICGGASRPFAARPFRRIRVARGPRGRVCAPQRPAVARRVPVDRFARRYKFVIYYTRQFTRTYLLYGTRITTPGDTDPSDSSETELSRPQSARKDLRKGFRVRQYMYVHRTAGDVEPNSVFDCERRTSVVFTAIRRRRRF